MINPNDIKPKARGKADFFSWQLYKWIKKYPDRYRIYEREMPNFPYKELYIGMISNDDPFYCHGRLLRRLCCYKEKIMAYAYGPIYGVREWRDVTDRFWSEYMKKGVCAIHGDLVHEWKVSDNTRICQYCGKVEYKKTIMVPKAVWGDCEFWKN